MRAGIAIPIVVVLAWWAVSVTRSLSASRTPAAAEGPASPEPAFVPGKQVQTQDPNAATKTAAATPEQDEGLDMARPFPFQKELSSYLDLQTKVFLNDSEKKERSDLLRHAGLLKALGTRLIEATRNPEVMREQDAAIDLLLEALKEGDSTVAAQVLQAVVSDRQVEDTKLEKSAREQLAGLKAEVLYQWSSTNPGIVANLQAWLPGPVSKKIWDNVIRMQESNDAESALERSTLNH